VKKQKIEREGPSKEENTKQDKEEYKDFNFSQCSSKDDMIRANAQPVKKQKIEREGPSKQEHTKQDTEKYKDFNFNECSSEEDTIKAKISQQLPPTPACSQKGSPPPKRWMDGITRHNSFMIKNEAVRMCTACVYSFNASHATLSDREVNPNYNIFAFAIFGTTSKYHEVLEEFSNELQTQKVNT